MILKTACNNYTADVYGYGLTLPDVSRTWSCTIEPDVNMDATECAADLAGGSVDVYNGDLLVETITGFTKIRQFTCSVKDDSISAITITIQEPGLRELIETQVAEIQDAICDISE